MGIGPVCGGEGKRRCVKDCAVQAVHVSQSRTGRKKTVERFDRALRPFHKWMCHFSSVLRKASHSFNREEHRRRICGCPISLFPSSVGQRRKHSGEEPPHSSFTASLSKFLTSRVALWRSPLYLSRRSRAASTA